MKKLQIPTMIVVNKVDRAGVDTDRLKEQLARQLSENCVYLQEVKEAGDIIKPCWTGEKGFIETLPRRGVDPLDRAKWILSCRSAY